MSMDLKINDKISFDLKTYEMTSCWDTPFGLVYLYKFRDLEDNLFIWKTSRLITKNIKSITSARIKDFIEYDNEKEIQLKYCKVC